MPEYTLSWWEDVNGAWCRKTHIIKYIPSKEQLALELPNGHHRENIALTLNVAGNDDCSGCEEWADWDGNNWQLLK